MIEGNGSLPAPPRSPLFLSVVMPVKNAEATISRQIEALIGQKLDDAAVSGWELIIADNGSTDATVAIASSYGATFDALVVIDASDAPGASHARNAGARSAKGDDLVFCDGDDEVLPGWLAAYAEAFAGGADLVAGPLVTEEINPPESQWRPSPIVESLPSRWDFLPFGYSANLGITAAAFSELGGFDESLLCGGEDVDLCWRAQLGGLSLRFSPEARVHYRFKDGPSAIFRQTFTYGLSDPILRRRFKKSGLRTPVVAGLARWAWLAKHVPDALQRGAGRERWMLTAGYCAGRLVGSFRERTLVI